MQTSPICSWNYKDFRNRFSKLIETEHLLRNTEHITITFFKTGNLLKPLRNKPQLQKNPALTLKCLISRLKRLVNQTTMLI